MRVVRIFRGWVRPGVDPGFLIGGRWSMEGPKAPSEARHTQSAGAPRGWNDKLVHLALGL